MFEYIGIGIIVDNVDADVRFRAFLKASQVKCPFEEENK